MFAKQLQPMNADDTPIRTAARQEKSSQSCTCPAELEEGAEVPAPGAEADPRAAARRLRTVPRSLGMLFMTSTCAACRFSIHSLQAMHLCAAA